MKSKDHSDRHKEVKEHFLTYYANDPAIIEFPVKRTACKLTCKFSGKGYCDFKSQKQASYSGAIGEDKSDVMLIAESPSTNWKLGATYQDVQII